MPRAVADSVRIDRVFLQCCGPLLRDLVRACRESAVCANANESTRFNKVDKAKVFGQFHLRDLSRIEVGPGDGRYSGRRATRLQETTLGVGSGIKDAKGPGCRTVGVIETIVAGCPK